MESSNQFQEQQSNSHLSDDEQELNYWSEEFGIAKEELLAVLKHGGTVAAAVEAYVMKLKFAV
ncbi:DUF3606 domain-containing protein [Mucilaginibacter sp. L196]|uniref:DUF3606 domain-containing protein n=1 Tax=Mucilaginibacter sp. L196 TaxID=1641870 RepID=UPI00131D8512|nr:DUF3606 domain-containing protein [Mucilaginibacter sp. L196]